MDGMNISCKHTNAQVVDTCIHTTLTPTVGCHATTFRYI